MWRPGPGSRPSPSVLTSGRRWALTRAVAGWRRASRWQVLLRQSGIVLTFMQVVERRQTLEAWLELAGADDARRRAVAEMLSGAPRQAREQIGYAETPEPSFLKRWIVLVGRK